MPAKSCPNNQEKIIGQTLFLGASVANFNNSIGWGSSSSQLTVNLVDDSPVLGSTTASACGGTMVKMYPDLVSGFDTPNHYYVTTGNALYEVLQPDGTAVQYDPNQHDVSERMVAGKIYHKLNATSNLFYSNYWLHSDPGFFGEKTILAPDWQNQNITTDASGIVDVYGKPGFVSAATGYVKYDIIDTPVYFRMGDFSFCGLIQSWQTSLSNSGKGYSVTINSMQSLLNSCYIILDKFGGSIFAKKTGSTFGGSPKNYLKTDNVNYKGTISEGNIPNVFNVYGFLESFGFDNFGVARRNERGIQVSKVLDALSVLTSSLKNVSGFNNLNNTQGSFNKPFSDFGSKHIFSPYGRIIAKHMQVERTNDSITNPYDGINQNFNSFGIIPPTPTMFNDQDYKCQFLLDLSEIPKLPDSFRVSEPVMSIMALLNLIGEQIGHDIFIEAGPVYYDLANEYFNVIKVKTISRLGQPRNNVIENTVNQLACQNYSISNYTLGKEKNDSPNRSMVIGASQQRLYQAKSYRLGYTQSNFILNPSNGEMINYQQLGRINSNNSNIAVGTKYYHHGKTKFPNFLSTRNPTLIPYYGVRAEGSGYVPTGVIMEEHEIIGNFNSYDPDWDDTNETSPSIITNAARPSGNYLGTEIIKQTGITSTWNNETKQRWIPIYADVICPFFGYVNDEELTIKPSENNNFRQIRPVWFDSWTGQSCVVVRISELPEISVELSSGYFVENSQKCSASVVTTPTSPTTPITTPSTGVQTIFIPGGGNIFLSSIPKTTCYTEFGVPTDYTIKYVVISESEIRAALAGFDNFLVYELTKYYKPDLIETLRLSYFKKIRDRLIQLGHTTLEANEGAKDKTNWYWNITSSNIANDELKPGFIAPDKNQGSSYIPEDALKDLQILHKFVADIGKYYGKKYMVTAPKLASYQDEDADLILPTYAGNAYIFQGDGRLHYNYEPTNDGAWEEYGNFIDDSIVVGGTHWYALSDDGGKIKPIIGYNASPYFDYLRFSMCQLAQSGLKNVKRGDRFEPMWDWEGYSLLMEKYTISCNHKDFIFPSLDYSTLSSDQYVLATGYERLNTIGPIQSMNSGLTSLTPPTKIPAYNAFGHLITDNTGTKLPSGSGYYTAYKQKLYLNTTVEENFVYLDPEKLTSPKFLIDSPGVYLNHSSSEYAQDPNRTVIANVTIEDLLVYMKTTPPSERDTDWMRYMLNYTMPINKFDESSTEDALGSYGSSNNQSSLRIEIAPKSAHPMFAGIPIKSNQFCYGPWVNNPYLEYLNFPNTLFPSGAYISCSGDPVTSQNTLTSGNFNITASQAKSGCNNWIGTTEVEIIEDMAPWIYGGVSQLDNAAFRYIATKINYQSIIETAQVDMPGLPLFSLGGVFNARNAGIGSSSSGQYKATGVDYQYYDVKYKENPAFNMSGYINPGLIVNPISTTGINTLNFKILNIISPYPVTQGPIITNIQTSVGQGGITTTYTFRTYSRKMGLFNKEQSDIIKKNTLARFKMNKQMSEINRQSANNLIQQRDFMDKQRLEQSLNFNTEGFKSKLFGTSPSTVFIGRSIPFIEEPKRTPEILVDYTKYTNPGDLATKPGNATKWSGVLGLDPASVKRITDVPGTDKESINRLSLQGRYKTSVGLYERKEADSELNKQYGLNSAMSLDGLLSPISFYPTLRNSTFAYSLYDILTCPFCKGTKKRSIESKQYKSDGSRTSVTKDIFCDKCSTLNNKLNATLTAKKESKSIEKIPPYIISSGTDMNTLLNIDSNTVPMASSISPINLITLNPIVISHGEFKNSNSQNYYGAHPDGVHDDITSQSDGFETISQTGRPFVDRLRHSIEIVGRGAMPPGSYRYALETSKNFTKFDKHPTGLEKNNLDYFNKDIMVKFYRDKLEPSTTGIIPEMNYRFFALRGPLTMHGWGYDTEGYPVPNASDEPYAVDEYGRYKRFKQKTIDLGPIKYGRLLEGDPFKLIGGTDTNFYTKTFNKELVPKLAPDGSVFTDDTKVTKYKIIDDYSHAGGYDPVTYKGSIISKTQKYNNNAWSEKVKMKQFYLNWAERQDLWPVGPIDMRWDEARRLWTCKEDPKIYKFVYVTLEEDLVKEPDYDETYPTKAFLDDIEYSQEPLPNGYRRLVYVKDKAGYTAPKGTKLLCRYNIDSGFYEPMSKPILVAKGIIASSSTATIDMHYIQGRKSGTIPTALVTFDNPLSFSTAVNDKGIFTYINGLWTLTAKKQ
jgi:hypothetical protein